MARYADSNDSNPYPVEPDPTANPDPQQVTPFHGGLTPIQTLPDGRRVYRAADGSSWTDDPNMGSVSGYIPYQAPTAGGTGENLVPPPGAVPPPTGGTGDVYTQPAPVDLGGPKGIEYIPPTPVFDEPAYTPPPAFRAPTGEDVLNDPGYQFRRDEGANALMRNKAAQGVLNTGGTLKSFLDYNQNFANQEYGNVWDRAAKTYEMNYGTQTRDPYTFNYQAALDKFQPQILAYTTQAQAGQRGTELNQSYSWQQYLEDARRRQQDFQNRFNVATA